MSRKALIITSVSGFVPQFEMENVKILQNMGYEVHYATNYNNPSYGEDNSRLDGTGIVRHQVDFTRAILPFRDIIKAYRQLVEIMKKERFALIHCHTPIAAVLGRMAAHKTDMAPVIYTAHGFHFFKGAPLLNWLLYYPAERYFARYTDAIITINEEDYIMAQKMKLREGGRVYKVNGVGIDYSRISSNVSDRRGKRAELGIPDTAKVIISVGEINDNKNHITVCKAMKQLDSDVHYIICGKGERQEEVAEYIHNNGLSDRVHMLHFRTDVTEIMKAADVFVMPSKREGLPVAMMEAMACGLPVIAMNIRGCRDLVDDGKGGILLEKNVPEEYADAIRRMFARDYRSMGAYNCKKAEKYDKSHVKSQTEAIYAHYIPKVLLVTTVSGFVPQFEMGNVRILQEMGYEVHYATNYNMPAYGNDNSRLDGTGIVRHQVDFHRSPYRMRENVKAYRQLRQVLCEDRYSLVHCHTPMGAALARLAAHNTHTAPVVYTAHGFHFFTGAKVLNWLVYYTVEKIFAHWTDVLITINQEDYDRASKHFHMRKRMWHKGCVKKINGVGIDLEKYKDVQVDRAAKRKELGLADDDYVFVSVGELIHRKNHQIVIRALAQMKTDKNVKYIICGQGALQQDLEELIQECGVEDKVKLLGYRTDVKEILKVSDCFIFPSKQEGLPVALMEAMASGIPVLCSKIRGNVDLINHESQIIDITSPEKCARAMERKTELQYIPSDMSRFEEKNVRAEMRKIYGEIL